MNDFKFWNGGCTEDEFYEELKEAAWNILHENPDTDLENWKMMLIEQYPTEVVDALGTNPPEIFAELSDWWDSMDYDEWHHGSVLHVPGLGGILCHGTFCGTL